MGTWASLLGDKATGVMLELLPSGLQLRLACEEEGVSGGEVGAVLFNLLEIDEQVVAHGVLAASHQCLGHAGGLLLGGEPQG